MNLKPLNLQTTPSNLKEREGKRKNAKSKQIKMNKKEQKKIERSILFKMYISFHHPCWITGIVFIVLKLTNNLDWSWWWITSPLWGYYIAGLMSVILFYLLAFIFLAIWHLLIPLICKLIVLFLSIILSPAFMRRCKDAYNQAQVQIQAQDYDVDITSNNEREEDKHIAVLEKIEKPKKRRKRQNQKDDIEVVFFNEGKVKDKHIDIPTKIKPFKKKRRTKLKE